MNVPNRVWLNPSDFPNGRPNQIYAYNRTYFYYLTENNGTWCYVLVGALKPKRKNVAVPPPTPCQAPTIELFFGVIVDIVGGVGTLTAFQIINNISGGVSPYSYALSKDGTTYTPFNTDPNLVSLTFDCNEFFNNPNPLVYLKVASNCPPFNTSDTAQTSILLTNDDESCTI